MYNSKHDYHIKLYSQNILFKKYNYFKFGKLKYNT